MHPHRALWFLPALLALSFAQVNPQENLLYAEGEGDVKLVRALIAKGADVNFRTLAFVLSSMLCWFISGQILITTHSSSLPLGLGG